MGLTSAGFVITVTVIAVLAVVAVPLLWDRTRWKAAVRSGTTLVAVASVVFAAGAFVNAQAGFFPTWGALFGSSQAGLPLGQGVDADLSGLAGRGATDHALVEIGRHSHGRGMVVRVSFGGGRSGISRPGVVYLPAAYFSRAWRGFRFPVLEVLSGSPGNPASELKYLQITKFLDMEIAAQRMQPTVAVIPTTNPSVLHDSECVNAVGGDQDDTYLTEDVRNQMLRDFRVREDRRAWALMGNSTGGYCAVNLALRHPQWYGAAVSLSGYFHAIGDLTTGDLFRGRSDIRNANDPGWTVRHWPLPPIALYLVAGSREAEAKEMRAFATLIHPPASVTTVESPGGGHSFGAWRLDMPGALDWLGGTLAAPLPPRARAPAGTIVRVKDDVIPPRLPQAPLPARVR